MVTNPEVNPLFPASLAIRIVVFYKFLAVKAFLDFFSKAEVNLAGRGKL